MEEEVLEQQEQEQEQAPAAAASSADTETASYTLEYFNLERALAGNAVTNIQTSGDLSTALTTYGGNTAYICGLLVHEPSSINPPYYVKINGTFYYADRYGNIYGSNPAQKLKMLVATMKSNTSVGTRGAITRGGVSERDVDLSSMEPRDQMAAHALNSMLAKLAHPDSVDDATILQYTRAAYRWAQGMVIASSDSRPEESSTPSPTPTPSPSDVTPVTNTEKLLNNIILAIGDLDANTQNSLVDIKSAINNFASWFAVTKLENTIAITASVYQTKYVKLAFASGTMAYSDLTINLTLACTEGTAAVTKVVTVRVPAGTMEYIVSMDAAVTAVTGITAKSIGSKAPNDANTYSFT